MPEWTDQDQRHYLAMLAESARAALSAWDRLRSVGRLTPPHPEEWSALKSFLSFSADVARWLSPSLQARKDKGDTKEDLVFRELRGRKLRELVNVSEDSPVLDRSVRNIAEHFDEYFDRWHRRLPHLTADDVEAGAQLTVNLAPNRLIDRASWTIDLVGVELDLERVAMELRRIARVAARLEPLARNDSKVIAYALLGVPPLPPELQLGAPSRYPDEPVTAGADLGQVPEFETIIRQAVDAVVPQILGQPPQQPHQVVGREQTT